MPVMYISLHVCIDYSKMKTVGDYLDHSVLHYDSRDVCTPCNERLTSSILLQSNSTICFKAIVMNHDTMSSVML